MKIVWSGSFTDPTGYGQTSRLFVKELIKDIDVHIRNVSFFHGEKIDEYKFFEDLPEYSVEDNYDIHIQMVTPEHFVRLPNAKINIGFTMFETDRLPKHWKKFMDTMDYIITSSEHNVKIFTNTLKTKRERILKVYPGFDSSTVVNGDTGALRKKYGIPTDKRIILSVADYNPRKGITEIIDAINNTLHENLFFVTRFTPVFRNKECIKYDLLHSLHRKDNNIIFCDPMSRNEIYELMAISDFLYTPTRGEGYGLPIIEAMAHQCIPIATNWSAQTEYLDHKYARMLDYDLNIITPNDYSRSLYYGHKWAIVKDSEIDKAMYWCSVVSHKKIRAMKKLARQIANTHSIVTTTKDLLLKLNDLTNVV